MSCLSQTQECQDGQECQQDQECQQGQECPICLEALGTKNVVTTECGHKFHFSCMVTNMKNSNTCPLCRAVVDDEPRPAHQLEDLTSDEVEDLEYSITELTGRNQETSRAIINYIASQMVTNRSPNLTGDMEVGVREIVTRYVSEIVHDFVHILSEFTNAGDIPSTLVDGNRSLPVGGINTTPEVDNAYERDDQEMLDQALNLLWNYYYAVSEPAAQGDSQALSLRDYITRVREQLDSGYISRDEYDIISHEVRDAILADTDYQGWRQIQSLIFSEGESFTFSEVESLPDPPPYPPPGAEPPVGDSSTPPVMESPERPITPVRVPEEIHAIDRLPAQTLNYIDCIINTNFELNEINFLNELPEFEIINNVRN